MPHLHQPSPAIPLLGRTAWPAHYCGKQHNPKYPCPAPEVEFAGIPASGLPGCACIGLDHVPRCPRRAAIVDLCGEMFHGE